jgi:DNA helicase-2/ATP-dependent DNA helicase PcrA
VKSYNILVVTFTNKGAANMREVIKKMVPNEDFVANLTMKTFHSFCNSILLRKREHFHLENFSVYEESDQRKVLKQCVLEMEAMAVKNGGIIIL